MSRQCSCAVQCFRRAPTPTVNITSVVLMHTGGHGIAVRLRYTLHLARGGADVFSCWCSTVRTLRTKMDLVSAARAVQRLMKGVWSRAYCAGDCDSIWARGSCHVAAISMQRKCHCMRLDRATHAASCSVECGNCENSNAC